jgi:two-component system NtrC family sensor kinase
MNHKFDEKPDGPANGAGSRSDTRELEPAPSQRQPRGESAEIRWLDGLLLLSARLGQAGGVEEVLKQGTQGVANVLPRYAVGTRIARPDQRDWLVQWFGPSEHPADSSTAPERLFPGLPHERVVKLDDFDGSTLHVAGEDPALLESDTCEARLVERAGAVLKGALRGARTHEQLARLRRDLERFQARIIQGEKLASLGQIVANVVHELNNPLTSIMAYADYLQRLAKQEGRSEDEQERLQRITEAALRAQQFARDLVEYSRPSSESRVPVSLNDVVDKALKFCEHEFSVCRVEINRNLCTDPPYVRGIAGHLVQVFVNLFTNAAQAMSEGGGRLTVAARMHRGWVHVEVADTGVGVDPASLEKVFEPYYTTRETDRGTGLGLAIVREIVVGHDGKLEVHSTPGRGTVFSISLPGASRD